MSLRDRFLNQQKEEEKTKAQPLPPDKHNSELDYETPETIDDNGEDVPNNRVYGSDRTRRQKTMLTFEKSDKSCIDIPYHQIIKVLRTNEKIITIYTHHDMIHIHGKNLFPIGQRIKYGSLSYVRESNRTNPEVTPDGTAVYSIVIEDLRAEK